jgi:O-methyltransferase
MSETSPIYTLIKKSMWIRRSLHNLVSSLEAMILSGYKEPEVMELIKSVNKESDLWVTTAEAMMIHSLTKAQRRIPGEMAEVGVYKGATAKLICEAKGEAPLHLFDTFSGLPEPSPQDDGFFTGGMFSGQLDEVRQYLVGYQNLSFYPGLFPETGEPVVDKSFSFVYLDVDLYQSTKDSLEFFYPRLSTGGVILSHDYQYPGVRQAFKDTGFADQVIELVDSQCMLVKL